jgi:hypothetical protein
MPLAYEIVTLDVGGAALVYPWTRAGQADPELVGGISRAYAGNQYTSIIAEFEVVPLVSQHRTSAEYGALKTLFAKGAQVPCQGKVFNPRTAEIITCSGKVTGEMEPGFVDDDGEPLWTVNLTLTEADNDDTAITASVAIYLSNVASPDVGGSNLATADESEDPFGAGVGSLELMNAPWVIPTCGGPPDPSVNCPIGTSGLEASWITAATVADGYLTGTPKVRFLSSGGTGDAWQVQSFMAKIIIVRGGVDFIEWETGWSDTNGGFSGGNSTATAPAIVFPSLAGDRVRVDIYSRAGLHGGYADDGVHQTLSFGNGGGGNHYGQLLLGGDILTMWP